MTSRAISWTAALVVAGTLLTGCGIAKDAVVGCGFGQSATLANACDLAISAAEARLGWFHSPIEAIDARPTGTFSWNVVFVFSEGDPVLVISTVSGDTAIASDPGPVPPGIGIPIP